MAMTSHSRDETQFCSPPKICKYFKVCRHAATSHVGLMFLNVVQCTMQHTGGQQLVASTMVASISGDAKWDMPLRKL